MDKLEVPVYLVLGFLESGKSSFIQEIFESGEFADGEKGVLISCEEGEVEVDEKIAAKCNVDVITIDEESELNADFLQDIQNVYKPHRIFIEYNGMWDIDTVFSVDMPKGWQIYQVVTMIDASTFNVYLSNMKAIIGNIIKCTELIIFNRCTEEMDLPGFRRIAKALNRDVQIMFEHQDGRMIELGRDVPPYDLTAPVVEVEDDDYGIWYIDATEDEERYNGKTIKLRAKVMKNRKFQKGYFVPGRNAMTCCADDIRFIGFLCKCPQIENFQHGQWVMLTAEMKYERRREYGGRGPVLYAKKVALTDAPKEDLVYFN